MDYDQKRRVRILSRRGKPSNDEILASAYSRGRIRCKIQFSVQVTRASTHSDHPNATESTYVQLKDPCNMMVDVATPEGCIALMRAVRQAVTKIQAIVGRIPGEGPNGASDLPPR